MWSLSAVLDGSLEGVLPAPERDRVETIARWCQGYLLNGHPELGRAGPVCPWCPPSVARGHFYLAHANVRFTDENSVITDLYRLRDRYISMAPESGPDHLLKTVVCVLSFKDKEPAPDELERWMLDIHRAAKPEFLRRGLMLGEFFQNNPATGLRSEAFEPLKSPSPLFVIRAMVPLDITFLSNRREYADHYFAKFSETAPKHIRDILNISPRRFARNRLRSLLQCLSWYGMEDESVDGLDLISGALLKDAALARLETVLGEDRTFRPLITALAFQPQGLGRNVRPGSIEHMEWLWHTAHVLKRNAGTDDFILRDGGRLIAVLSTSNPLDVRRVADSVECADRIEGISGTVSGRATEGIRDPYVEEWEWDGTDRTDAAALMDRAYADLSFQNGSREALNVKPGLEDAAGASSRS